MSMNVRRALPRIHFDQTLYRKANTCVFAINFIEPESMMLQAKFQDHRTSGSGEEGLYHIWAWWPSWLCDLDHLYKLSLPLPKEAPHEIWL